MKQADTTKNNLELVCTIFDTLYELTPRNAGDNYRDQISYVTDRPGLDFHYAIDASKN